MMNTEMMTLNLNRSEMCKIGLALTHLIIEMRMELNDENTSADRKAVLRSSIEMWSNIKAKVNQQIDEQDAQ